MNRLLAGGAENETGIATPIEQDNRLLAGVDGVAQEVFETLREQVHAAAHAGFVPQIDELDVRHRQALHAAGEF